MSSFPAQSTLCSALLLPWNVPDPPPNHSPTTQHDLTCAVQQNAWIQRQLCSTAPPQYCLVTAHLLHPLWPRDHWASRSSTLDCVLSGLLHWKKSLGFLLSEMYLFKICITCPLESLSLVNNSLFSLVPGQKSAASYRTTTCHLICCFSSYSPLAID